MDVLAQVVQVLSRYKRQNIDVLDNDDSTSRFTEFYRLIKEGRIKTDEEAAVHFYGAKAKPTDSKYRFFKSQFKDRLLNTLYFIDTDNPQFTDFQKAYYHAQHQWGAINLLYRRNIIYAADNLAERLLTVSMEYEFTDLCVPILERLKSNHATQIGNKKKYEEFKKLFWHYKAVWDAEHIAREAFEEIRIEYVKTTSVRPETSLKAQTVLYKLEELKEVCDSIVFLFNFYIVKEAVYSAKNDWKNVLIVCDEALAAFYAKPFTMKNYIAIFINQKVIALMMLHQYEACEQTLEAALELQEEGNSNWFKTMEKRMLLVFRKAAYTVRKDSFGEGYALLKQVKNLKEFKNLKDHSAEIWKLFEAYLYLIAMLDKTPNLDISNKEAFGSFRLNKFLNDVPTFAQDKKGMNLPIYILQIVLMISEKKMRAALIDRIETIEKYILRYVPKTDIGAYRTNQFIKALVEIPKSDFKSKILAQRTKKIIADLASVPENIIEADYKVEVMPYELLWETVLSRLS